MPTTAPLTRVAVRFIVKDDVPPQTGSIHAALRSLRGLEIEAGSHELAEHYGEVLVEALEQAGN